MFINTKFCIQDCEIIIKQKYNSFGGFKKHENSLDQTGLNSIDFAI